MIALEAQQDRAMAWSVLDRNDERWRRLRKLVSEHSLRVGDFKLSSGRRSPYLFQLRQTTMLPEGAALLGEVILEYMYQHSIECVGGLELGAVPLVSSVAVMSHIRALPISAFFVRKARQGTWRAGNNRWAFARRRRSAHGRRCRDDGRLDFEGRRGHRGPRLLCSPCARCGGSRGRRGGEFGRA